MQEALEEEVLGFRRRSSYTLILRGKVLGKEVLAGRRDALQGNVWRTSVGRMRGKPVEGLSIIFDILSGNPYQGSSMILCWGPVQGAVL